MGVKTLLAEIGAASGFHPDTSVEDRTYLLTQINKACKEMFESRDLVNCNREQLFMLDPQTQQIALPHYVFQIRGVRNYYTRRQIGFHDMRPRFQSSGWTEGLLTWRDKFRTPLLRELLNFAPLTMKMDRAEEAAVTVSVSGSTSYAERVTELVTFAIGEKVVQTTNGFHSIASITNTALHTCDVNVYDADCNLISVLPNSEYAADYRMVQVMDYMAISPSSPYIVEVLYKIRFQPLSADHDEFCCPGYDDAIIWKVMSYLLGKKDPEKALMADAKCNAVMRQMSDDTEQSVTKMVEFQANESLYMFNRGARRAHNMFPGSYW